MKFRRATWVAVLCALYSHAALADWTLYPFEGRDYVSLDEIAAFYGFPKPPPVSATPSTSSGPGGNAAPSTPVRSRASVATEFGLSLRDIVDPNAKPIALDSGTMQLEVTPGSRDARINGAKQWLAFPVHQEGSKILVSRLDLSKVIEPRLRPELIGGFQPVTTVVLDPGHGGHDNGAPSRYGYEKDFALDVALRTRKLLEAEHYKVVMTRATDVFIPLEQRSAVANHLADW